MTIATQKRLTLAEFLTYDNGSDDRYELEDGVLVEMGAESRQNIKIALFLMQVFIELVGTARIGIKEKIVVPSTYVTARDPDVMIHSTDSAAALEGRSESCLKIDDPNPLLVIEVVSPGTESTDNYQRDYVRKVREYAERGIPEYWLIDPSRAVVLVLTLQGQSYQRQQFQANQPIVSPTFPELNLTAAQILSAGA
jgi:Uma2 family endonuclease